MAPTPATPPTKSTKPITKAELAECDGSNPDKPVYVAIKGDVFDVTEKKQMYGPGASYNVFAGKDGSFGLGERAKGQVFHHRGWESDVMIAVV